MEGAAGRLRQVGCSGVGQLAEIEAPRPQYRHPVDDRLHREGAGEIHVAGETEVHQEIAIGVDLQADHRQRHRERAEIQVAQHAGQGELDLVTADIIGDLLVQHVDGQPGQHLHLVAVERQAQAIQVRIVEHHHEVDGVLGAFADPQDPEMHRPQPVRTTIVVRLPRLLLARVERHARAAGCRNGFQGLDHFLGGLERRRASDGDALPQGQELQVEVGIALPRHRRHVLDVLPALLRVEQRLLVEPRHAAGSVDGQGDLAVDLEKLQALDGQKAEVDRRWQGVLGGHPALGAALQVELDGKTVEGDRIEHAPRGRQREVRIAEHLHQGRDQRADGPPRQRERHDLFVEIVLGAKPLPAHPQSAIGGQRSRSQRQVTKRRHAAAGGWRTEAVADLYRTEEVDIDRADDRAGEFLARLAAAVVVESELGQDVDWDLWRQLEDPADAGGDRVRRARACGRDGCAAPPERPNRAAPARTIMDVAGRA